MLTVFTKVMTIFVMIGAGYLANKVKILPDQSTPYLTSLLINISTPCLVISSMTAMSLTRETLTETLEVLVVNAACLLITGAVSWVVIKLLRYEPKEDRGILMAVMTSINTGFLGFPVAKAIFGNEIFFLFVIQNINLNIYMYSLQVLQMNYGRKGGVHPKQILRAMATMPMFATILGCVLLFAGIKLPGPVSSFVGTMGDMTIPLSMVLVGVLLGKSPLLTIVRNYKLVIVCLTAEILMPFLTFFLVNWLPITPEAKLTCIYAEEFPCAVLTAAVAEQQHLNGHLASEGVALSTLISLGTLPVVSMILMHLYGGLI